MGKADEEIIRSIYERWNRSDGDLALDRFDEDVDIHQNPDIPDTARTFRGHEGLRASGRELMHAFRRIEWHPEAWFDEGDWLIVRVRAVGTGRASGIEQDTTIAHAWRLRDGRVTHFWVYPQVGDAVRALQAEQSDRG